MVEGSSFIIGQQTPEENRADVNWVYWKDTKCPDGGSLVGVAGGKQRGKKQGRSRTDVRSSH